jgi:hypothetical protein
LVQPKVLASERPFLTISGSRRKGGQTWWTPSAMLFRMTITYEWRGAAENEEINRLHAEGFDHAYDEID